MLSGIVTKGMGLAGKTYGVPTANISLVTPTELGSGTYAGIAKLGNETFPALIYYGQNAPLKLEVHLLDWSGDLYGMTLAADPLAKVAEYTPWVSTDIMKAKIADDMQRVRTWFALQKDVVRRADDAGRSA